MELLDPLNGLDILRCGLQSDLNICHNRRRVTSRSNANAPRGAIPGGSTSGMMRIYSDDSPGLRVYVSSFRTEKLFYFDCPNAIV